MWDILDISELVKGRTLIGWKEIADYLGVEESLLKRKWREWGVPLGRLTDKKRATPISDTSWLDEWSRDPEGFWERFFKEREEERKRAEKTKAELEKIEAWFLALYKRIYGSME